MRCGRNMKLLTFSSRYEKSRIRSLKEPKPKTIHKEAAANLMAYSVSFPKACFERTFFQGRFARDRSRTLDLSKKPIGGKGGVLE